MWRPVPLLRRRLVVGKRDTNVLLTRGHNMHMYMHVHIQLRLLFEVLHVVMIGGNEMVLEVEDENKSMTKELYFKENSKIMRE